MSIEKVRRIQAAPRLLGCLALSCCATAARADWPMFGHDVARTALTTGSSNIQKPVPRWRQYLGGSVGATGLVSEDLDNDGIRELLIVSGGRIIARHDDDGLVWDSPLIDAAAIADILDLDGDGQKDVIVRSADRVVLLAGKTGQIEWDSLGWKGFSYPLGNIGTVRLYDFDGDGALDLYVSASWCGASLTNAQNRGGIAFSFRNGGSLDAPKKLFETSVSGREYRCDAADVLADIDGDKKPEIITYGLQLIYAYSTVDGSLKYTSSPIGNIIYLVASADVADLDGDGREELVLYTSESYSANINSRRVAVAGMRKDKNGTYVFDKWWEKSVVDLTNDQHGYADSSLRDLDGDGKLEITTSFYDGMTKLWTLKVLDALTGSERASALDTGRLAGLFDLDGDGATGILTETAAGVEVYTFRGGALNHIVDFANTSAIQYVDRNRARTRTSVSRVLAVNACGGDTRPDLILFEKDAAGRPATIAAYQTALNVAQVRCHNAYDVRPDNETFLVGFALSPSLMGAARSSGYLTTLTYDDGVLASNVGTGEFAGSGVRIGGYYSGPYARGAIPIAPALGGGTGTPVLVDNSRGILLALDPRQATLVRPPKLLWAAANLTDPSAFNVQGTSTPEILGWRKNAVVVLDGVTGQELLRYQVAPPDSPTKGNSGDVLAADLNGDMKPELIYVLHDGGSGYGETHAVGLPSGAALWAQPYLGLWSGCVSPSNALTDVNRDGVLDVLTHDCGTFLAVDGKTGLPAPKRSVSTYAPLPLAYDLDGDGHAEIWNGGSVAQARAYRDDFTPDWTATDVEAQSLHFTYHGAAAAQCKTSRIGFASLEGGHFFMLDGTTGKVVNGMNGSVGVVLAQGGMYASEMDASAAGKRIGVLGNVTSANSLRGADAATFLIGSTDGWLYAVEACGGALAWALDLRSPVGQPIVADVAGTGVEQIVVSVADGYLYGIAQEVFPAPGAVRDVDPSSAHPHDQVTDLATLSTLYVEWDPVPGAQTYQCAVLTAAGTLVRDFVDCGNGTSSVQSNLMLTVGATYKQAVRAVGLPGTSVETISRGVRITPQLPITADLAPSFDLSIPSATDGGDRNPVTLSGPGCACRLIPSHQQTTSDATLPLALLLALLLRRKGVRP